MPELPDDDAVWSPGLICLCVETSKVTERGKRPVHSVWDAPTTGQRPVMADSLVTEVGNKQSEKTVTTFYY